MYLKFLPYTVMTTSWIGFMAALNEEKRSPHQQFMDVGGLASIGCILGATYPVSIPYLAIRYSITHKIF